MKRRGQLFVLYAEIASVMTLLGVCTSHSMTINNETVDVSDKGSFWRELLENAGISSVSIKAQGFCNDSAAFKFIKQSVINGTSFNARIDSDTEQYIGRFQISSFESSGEYNKGELFALTLESARKVSLVVPASYRLLEDGSRRLLEDGSFRILEAA